MNSEEAGEPLFNRAIQGGYPRARPSSWSLPRPALEGGLITPDTVVNDPGSIKVGGVTFKNAGDVVNGGVALRQALTVSSDVFFYKLGLAANGQGDGNLIQNWARKLGLGRRTGIDLPGEEEGLVPDRKWRNDLYNQKPKLTDRPWSVGDNINLSVGQGDLQADPLQLAVAYAAIANGGTRRHPAPRRAASRTQAGARSRSSRHRPPRKLEHQAREPPGDPRGPARRRPSEPGGTASGVFAGFKIPMAGKTGTAEKGAGRPDQSWYCGLGALPVDPVRGLRDVREWRLRRRHGSARRAPDHVVALRRERPGADRGRGSRGLRTDAGDALRDNRARVPRRRDAALRTHRRAAPARRAGAHRVLALHDRAGHAGRHPGRARTTSSTARRLHRRRPRS